MDELYPAKVPPNSREAEQSVLGSVLFRAANVALVTGRLRRDDFYFPRHQLIFDAIVALGLENAPVDILTVANYLEEKDLLDKAGGRAYVSELPDKVPVFENLEHYVRIVRKNSMLRRLIVSLDEVIKLAYKGENDVNHLIDLAAKRIYEIRENRDESNFEKIGDILGRTINQLQLTADGKVEGRVRTGFPSLDNITDGLRPGGFYVLAARPAVGKTSFALNIAHNAAKYDETVTAFFSLEMSKEEVGMRILVTESQVESKTLERISATNQALWERIGEALARLYNVPLYIDDRSAATVVEMQSKCKQLQLQHRLDLVIVDYLQLMAGSGLRASRYDSRQQEIAEISRMLKLTARELNVPVIALSQLSRDSAKMKRKPQLTDLRESGAIEQDADVVMFLHPRSEEKKENKPPPPANVIDLIVAKNRHGRTATIPLSWNAAFTMFYESIESDMVPPAP